MPSPHAHVSLVTLGVMDVVAAARFYEGMGFVRRMRAAGDNVAFFEAGSLALALYDLAALANDAGLAATTQKPGVGAITLAWNCASETDVDGVMALAIEAGGRCLVPAKKAVWGGYHGHFADPEGHIWEVAHNPQFPLAADGRVSLPD